MLLFALRINPLLINLDKKLNGLYIRHNSTKTTAVAFADDMIIVTQPEETDNIKEILHDYMRATCSRINTNKSRAIALDPVANPPPVMDITYHADIKLIGFHTTTNIQGSATKSSAMLTEKIRAQVQEAYHRALNIEHRIRYVNDILLARAWFTTQISPPPPPPPPHPTTHQTKTCKHQTHTKPPPPPPQTTSDRQTQPYYGSYGKAQFSESCYSRYNGPKSQGAELRYT